MLSVPLPSISSRHQCFEPTRLADRAANRRRSPHLRPASSFSRSTLPPSFFGSFPYGLMHGVADEDDPVVPGRRCEAVFHDGTWLDVARS